MKTLYLKASTKEAIISDIQQVAPYSKNEPFEVGYNGQIEYSDSNITVHYIGDIMTKQPKMNELLQTIEPAEYVGAQHCNIQVEDSFDESIFKTLTTAPNNPKHKFQ
jgi:hypothetical protein